jgi:hypothetical protein
MEVACERSDHAIAPEDQHETQPQLQQPHRARCLSEAVGSDVPSRGRLR